MKNSVASFVLVALLAAAFVATPLSLAGSPDGSFDPSQEECGFLMGTSAERTGAAYSAGTVSFDSIMTSKQACVNELGYFYKSATHTASWGKHSQWGKIDFAWSTNPNNNVRLGDVSGDGDYRYLKGRAALIDLDSSALGGAPVLDDKLQFDWSCEGEPWCDDAALEQRVKVNLSTGELTGVAWNVHTGYIAFDGVTMELAPREIQAFVDVFANDTDLVPGGVDLTTAPIADGYAFYRARVQFFDASQGHFLRSDEVSAKVSVVTTPNSSVYVDQVANKGSALLASSQNAFYPACVSTPSEGACVLSEADQSQSASWNSFVFSIAPTSNMLGIPDELGKVVKYPVDRDGGESWYPESPWKRGSAWMGDASDVREACGTSCSTSRDEFFYKRSVDRNRIEITAVNVTDIQFSPTYLAGGHYLLNWGEERAKDAVEFSYEPPENQKELSFRPQFKLTTLSATGGGLSLPPSNPVSVRYDGTVSNYSPQKRQAAPTEGARNYRVYGHAYSDLTPAGDGAYSDEYLLFTNANAQDNLDWVNARWGAEASSCPDENPFPKISGPVQHNGVHPDPLNGALQCVNSDGGGLSCPPGSTPLPNGAGCETPPPLHAYIPFPLVLAIDPLPVIDLDQPLPDIDPTLDIDFYPLHCAQGWSACDGKNGGQYPEAYCLDEADSNLWSEYWYCEDAFSSKDVLPARMEKRTTQTRNAEEPFAGTFDLSYSQAVTTDTAIAKHATEPSLEFYVCDELSASLKSRFGTGQLGNACYYTAYLSVADPYADPVGLKVKGAVNAVMNGADLLDNNENLSQLGVPTTDLRNRLYAQLRRYVVGESGTDFQVAQDVPRHGTLDENMEPKESEGRGRIASLLGGRLLYAQGAGGQRGDVTIEGSDSFLDTTLVVFSGDVHIDGDITGGRLQIFVFGGNVYIHPDVKNLYVNVFTDQAILSDHAKTGTYDDAGIPQRSPQEREKDLKNQLYVNGTLVSLKNTLKDTMGPELNLNALREFRYCKQINPVTGAIDTNRAPQPCDASQLSSYRENDEPVQNTVIVEHHAPSNRQLSLDLF